MAQPKSAEEMTEFIKNVVVQQQMLMEKEQRENLLLARQMRIQQQVFKYSRPADKTAMRFLLDAKYDMQDFYSKFSTLLQADGTTLKGEDEFQVYKDFVEYVVTWANMRTRKLDAETDSYHVANTARGGWATEKVFSRNKRSGFAGKSSDKNWWEEDDLSIEEKEKKLKDADREVLFQKKNKPYYGNIKRANGKSSRWDTPNHLQEVPPAAAGSAGSFNAVPARMWYPPRDLSQIICWNCDQPGHRRDACPKPPKKLK